MWRSLFGTVLLEIKSADISRMMEALTKWNITVMDLRMVDDLTITLTVSRSDYKRITAALEKFGCKIKVVGRKGVYWTAKGLLRRPVFTIGIILYLILVLTVPGRVFFVEIEGNQRIPDRLILEVVQENGFQFGAVRRDIRSEKIKNILLEKIPQLQWVGVNTNGCVAVISVRERQFENNRKENSFGSIVASRDAIIQQITVLRGTQLCKVGQAVKAGEILVSAYKDYGISVKMTGAKAEIFGQTEHNLDVVTPIIVSKRTKETGRDQKYSVIIGKKQINFFKYSGISDTSCVKMFRKTYLTLPGGYVLPVAFVTQEFIYYDTEVRETSDVSFIEPFSRSYLLSKMMAGRILQGKFDITKEDDICRFGGHYSCYELIGVTKNEEFIGK